jgi:YD repeat-containing protein
LSITGSSSYGQNFTYDANGSTLTATGSGRASSASYTWDPRGRMISARTGGATTSFTYDDSDNRTSETAGSSTMSFLNNPNQTYDQVLEQYAPGGVLAA